ncbi:hypothetical protein D5018_19830 [Parashewanella curva]|uniref:Uncharacterized protein n=1 Tax=Parashewanella curva TaxID=2338552 RepID=A0A3L8PT05_9GAMM|nr:phage regulatory CII family protein [Parashewanella curva]RLV57949.1 hypothetical protein D5018_19830 [Parashewanella curva]
MYIPQTETHPHVNGSFRAFAINESLKDVALASGFHNPQLLRNKLLINQPHQLTLNELVKITKVSKNRCIVDGLLLELDCLPSVPITETNQLSFTDVIERTLSMNTELGHITELTLALKQTRKLTEAMRHQLLSHITSLMTKLGCYAHIIEQRYSSKLNNSEY